MSVKSLKYLDFLSQSRDPAVQAAILAQLNAKYGSGVLPDAPKEMSKASAALSCGLDAWLR